MFGELGAREVELTPQIAHLRPDGDGDRDGCALLGRVGAGLQVAAVARRLLGPLSERYLRLLVFAVMVVILPTDGLF